MEKSEIIEKLYEISVRLQDKELKSLIKEIANLQSWHTGTPEKEGWYLIADGNLDYPYHPAKWTRLFGWKDCEIHPKDIVAWQEIKPHKAS